MGEKSNLELYREREREILEQLGRMKEDDPARKPLVEELSKVSSIIVAYEQTDQTRLNNNAQNDINEQRLIIDEKKIVQEDKRIRLGLFQGGLYTLVGAGLAYWSYHMDEENSPYKMMKDRVEKALSMIRGK